MTSDKEKLQDLTKYNGGRVVVTVNNSRLPISHVGTTIFTPQYGPHKVLQDAYYPIYEEKLTLDVSANIIKQVCLVQSSRCQGGSRLKDLRDTYYGRTKVKVNLWIVSRDCLCR